MNRYYFLKTNENEIITTCQLFYHGREKIWYILSINGSYWQCLTILHHSSRLHLCRGVRTSPKQNVLDMTLNHRMVELWVMWSPLSLPLLPGLLWPGAVEPVMDPSMSQMELLYYSLYLTPFNCMQKRINWTISIT